MPGRKSWTYGGVPVVVSATADIPANYRVGHLHARVVQGVLNRVPQWRGSGSTIFTVRDLRPTQSLIVIPHDGARLVWAKHVGHHARRVGLSPFVMKTAPKSSCFTVELVGASGRPMLVRAYPGEYIPPLPWQQSARDVDGGIAHCRAYWREHAYVHAYSLVSKGTATQTPPEWFSTAAS